MAAEIPLTKGYVALVDNEDASRVMKLSWRVLLPTRGGVPYAITGAESISMHRFILGMGRGHNPVVDHIDHDGLNNQKSNLRLISSAQNVVSRRRAALSMNNYFGYGGVYSPKARHFYGRIVKDGKRYMTRRCYTPLEAAIARDELAKELYGEFATLNFPNGAPA